MVFIILRKPWGFCGKLHYIQIHPIPSCLLETIYKFSNCQANDSSVYMLLDLGFDITFLSLLLFLYCLLCWDYSLSLPSLNEDTWGPVLGPFPHQVFITFENLKKAMDLPLTKVTYILIWIMENIWIPEVKNPCSKCSLNAPEVSITYWRFPKLYQHIHASNSLLDVQQVLISIYLHGTHHCPS